MTGDQDDIVARLHRWLPTGWFPTDPGTRIAAVLSGFASLFARIYAAIVYAQKQTRLASLSDGFADLASFDFFGDALPRLNAEPDDHFSLRIRKEIVRKKLTREAIDDLLSEMTGFHPKIVELERPADCGAWGARFAWGVHGCWGSRSDRFAVFITTARAGQFGIPLINGWGGYAGGWGQGRMVWAGPDMLTGTGFSDAQIMAALNRIRAAGVTYWVNITNAPFEPYEALTTGSELLLTEAGESILV